MIRPFKTKPLLLPKIWGGRFLETEYGKTLPDDQPYGESWEVADLPEGQCLVDGGPLHGHTLSEVVQDHGVDLLGAAADRFPLLVKILDAQEILSVQVHPGAQDLSRHPGAFLKDESWFFLHTEGEIFHGVKEGVTLEQFQSAIEEGSVMDLMRTISPERFDSIRVAPGTMHAIGGGVALIEVQTPSDTTYRVWDHGRLGMDGSLRDLHVEQAMDVARFENTESLRPSATYSGLIVETDAYSIERIVKSGDLKTHGKAKVVINIGEGSFRVGDVVLLPFETAIVPACCEHPFNLSGDALVCWAG